MLCAFTQHKELKYDTNYGRRSLRVLNKLSKMSTACSVMFSLTDNKMPR